MRYKGEYSPSFLLDPEEYSWHPLKECVPLLDKYAYACFTHPERSSRRIVNETNGGKGQDAERVEKAAEGAEDGEEVDNDGDEDEDEDADADEEKHGYEDALTAAAGAYFNPVIDEIQIISSVTRQGVEVVVGGPVSITKLRRSNCPLKLLWYRRIQDTGTTAALARR